VSIRPARTAQLQKAIHVERYLFRLAAPTPFSA
jgi:hypothetical protein